MSSDSFTGYISLRRPTKAASVRLSHPSEQCGVVCEKLFDPVRQSPGNVLHLWDVMDHS